MKKFGTGKRYADAGTVTKAPEMSLNDIRLRRKTDDIQSDYMKAQARNAGNTAKLNVAKAKYEQRMADAKDDMAKWSGSDRTATRKGEADAEAALTQARRTRGQSIADRDTAAAKPTATPAATTATAATAAKPDYDKMSFAKAFAAARKVPGRPNFMYRGKPITTDFRGEDPKATAAARLAYANANDPEFKSFGPLGLGDMRAKGGAIKKKPAAKKYAKGGSIDGCAIRGKTRAGRTK
jgi:hypothetical protein